jgi:hypothetical protein
MKQSVKNGTQDIINGKPCVYYDGYWMRYYQPPADNLAARKDLICQLTRRAFHNTESGINTPGENLELAREAYHHEEDPDRKRVNGAMLAGALFNRATDIFTTVVALEEKGVEISVDNELMKQCGEYFKEALELGKQVKHYSGQEGIDEVWGEPFKAFSLPMAVFYETRYIKLARAMADMDSIADKLIAIYGRQSFFSDVCDRIRSFTEAAKIASETMKCDRALFQVWPAFIAEGEALMAFFPKLPENASEQELWHVEQGLRLLREGKNILVWLSDARVPMPITTTAFHRKCDEYLQELEHNVA